jgi:hypothetical protein
LNRGWGFADLQLARFYVHFCGFVLKILDSPQENAHSTCVFEVPQVPKAEGKAEGRFLHSDRCEEGSTNPQADDFRGSSARNGALLVAE